MASRLSQEQVDLICSLREEGRTFLAISEQIGCSKSAVQGVCLRNGVYFQKQWKPRPIPDQPVVHKGKKRTIRLFTRQEDQIITHARMKGTRISQIAKRLNRAPASIRKRLETLAIHEGIEI